MAARKIRKPPPPDPAADPFNAACGEWVSAALDAAALSPADMKRDHGFSEGKMSEYRKGLREPRLSTLVRIAAITGYDLRPLMVKLTRIAANDMQDEK